MGSFANSLHVKSEDAVAVADAVRASLIEGGYRVTHEGPGEEAAWAPSPLRAVYVSDSRAAWVGLLDSDLVSSFQLAVDLSQQLDTHAIFFMVNDSDSWHYQLYAGGKQLDEFDSSGGADGFGMEAGRFGTEDVLPDIISMFSHGGFDSLQRNIEETARRLQEQAEENMPPEIRRIWDKMQQDRASPEEMQQYGQWAGTLAAHGFMDVINDTTSDVLPFPKKQSAGQDDLDVHLDRLRPLIAPGIGDVRVLEILGKQATFAEHSLAEFMELIGLQPFFAHLSYRYLEECSRPELIAAGIQFVHHLKFKMD